MSELESLLHRLIQYRLEFVIVGGFAAMAHGVTLLTQDIDVSMPFNRRSLRSLEEALADLHPVHRLTPARLPFELNERISRLLGTFISKQILARWTV